MVLQNNKHMESVCAKIKHRETNLISITISTAFC
jgi:hypothetical protein